MLWLARGSLCFILIVTFALATTHGRPALAQSNGDRVATDGNSAEPRDQENHSEAIAKAERALDDAERQFGSDHSNVAKPLLHLAALYHLQGQYVDAEPLYKRVLAIVKKVPGHANDPLFATLLNLMAEAYRHQGRYAEAEPLYKRALAIYEKSLGSDHPKVSVVLSNLALVYHDQGRYTEAEPLLKRALAIGEKELGPDHRNVAISLTWLAKTYLQLGQYAEAEPLYRRAGSG